MECRRRFDWSRLLNQDALRGRIQIRGTGLIPLRSLAASHEPVDWFNPISRILLALKQIRLTRSPPDCIFDTTGCRPDPARNADLYLTATHRDTLAGLIESMAHRWRQHLCTKLPLISISKSRRPLGPAMGQKPDDLPFMHSSGTVSKPAFKQGVLPVPEPHRLPPTLLNLSVVSHHHRVTVCRKERQC